jgi:hypothetical protein
MYTSPAQIILNQLTSVRSPMIISECHHSLWGFLIISFICDVGFGLDNISNT